MNKRIKRAVALAVLAAMVCLWMGGCATYSEGTSTSQPAASTSAPMKADSTAAPAMGDTTSKP